MQYIFKKLNIKMRGGKMIGDRIKELRDRSNMTQNALAKKLGITRSAVNAWEMGISIPSTQYIVELSRLFKVPSDFILELDSNETINISEFEKEEKEIIYRLIGFFEEYHDMLQGLKEKYSSMEYTDDFMKEAGVRSKDNPEDS